ncbi:MAG: hypothetical protein ABSB86_01705 [Bryobacteraceae bacterium]
MASACALFACAQGQTPAGAPAKIIVTIGHHYGQSPPVLTREDLIVTEQYQPLRITNVVPLCCTSAALEIYFLVDNCSNCEPGSKFEELRRFINAQPPTTLIGVAYIRNGRLELAEKPTQDRARAIQALNAPEGSKPASPFSALTDLINGWPADSARHVVLMVSNGIDPAPRDEFKDPAADAAIEAAQRAGVAVYAIYHPSADYLGADSSKIYSGQIQLAHLAVETGGEAYFLGFGPLPSLAPFLSDIADHLANQYLVEFLASPGEAGALEEVTVRSKAPDVELVVPARVWVPGLTTLHPR